VPVAHWTVPQLAASAGTVGELSGGKFALGIGTGGAYTEGGMRAYGMGALPPISLMRDWTVGLRTLLAGERVDYEGKTVTLKGVQLGFTPPRVPVYIGALGPQMLRLAGQVADGAALNWCSPEQIAWSRRRVAEGAKKAGRDPSEVTMHEYIRVCVDEDIDLARRTLARATLGYAMARPGARKDQGYRAHFARMGFDEALTELETRRERGEKDEALAEAFPKELLSRTSVLATPKEAAAEFRRLAKGLDVAVVRIVPARPGVHHVLDVMRACAPGT
jgi:alkanesulfonate monooxygenase SsuD/methylene tetrahydromethanopterin reductase-like flavin-dependent oxidoreductase (luciferase family)